IRAWDRQAHRIVEFGANELEFGYRDSVIKRSIVSSAEDFFNASPRWIVLSVDLRLTKTGQTAPVRYTHLAKALLVATGSNAPLEDIRQTVLWLCASKGMVLVPSDYDTWSSGSFFTIPIVPVTVADTLPENAPRFAHAEANG